MRGPGRSLYLHLHAPGTRAGWATERAPPAAQFRRRQVVPWAAEHGCRLDAEGVQTLVGVVACPSSVRTRQLAQPASPGGPLPRG